MNLTPGEIRVCKQLLFWAKVKIVAYAAWSVLVVVSLICQIVMYCNP